MRSVYDKASQFIRDYLGFNGKGAESCAKDTVKYMENSFYNGDIIFEGDGAMKWKSNGAYLPEECADAMAFIDIRKASPTQKAYIRNASVEATANKRDMQTEEFLKEYRKAMKNHVLSDEERYEMKCAFGEGANVVDVVTGQVYQL